ncbi:hypothetical protein ACFL1H_06905 [Nanoarchaeota archaeon]
MTIDVNKPVMDVVKESEGVCYRCRNTKCCQDRPVLVDREIYRIADYLDMKVDDLIENGFNRKEVYFKERLMPKKHNFYCIFGVGQWIKDEEKQKEIIKKRMEPSSNLFMKLYDGINLFSESMNPLRLSCGIYSARPTECKIILCGEPELSEYFTEKFLVDQNDSRTLKVFEEEKARNFSKGKSHIFNR